MDPIAFKQFLEFCCCFLFSMMFIYLIRCYIITNNMINHVVTYDLCFICSYNLFIFICYIWQKQQNKLDLLEPIFALVFVDDQHLILIECWSHHHNWKTKTKKNGFFFCSIRLPFIIIIVHSVFDENSFLLFGLSAVW